MSRSAGTTTSAARGIDEMRAVAQGTTSVVAAAAEALATIERLDAEIGAFRIVEPELVAAAAAAADADPSLPLRGLIVGVKDVIDTADLPTGYGSPLFADHQPVADSDLVAACRRAGAVVAGKTESTEFAMFTPTRTRNPIDPSRTPGGSSSGSAAAVAAGMVPVAFGTQTAGSVIRPAAYCGVYGYKPVKGWVSTAGIWKLTDSFDTVGIFARNVADLTMTYYGVRGDPQPAERMAVLRPDGVRPRIAVLDTEAWGECEPEVDAAIEWGAEELVAHGCHVEPLDLPAEWADLPAVHATIMAVEVAHNLHARLGDDVERISPSAREIVARGDACSADEHDAARTATAAAVERLSALEADFDVILAPSALGVAPTGLEFTGDPVMCRPWTLLCAPATNLPYYRRADGLPVGVQAVGVRADDESFLTSLAWLEAALGDSTTNPPFDEE
ncbi:MAG TPA: amidase [Mycobacteriales bacterium]|nr:amidase [Mycobacteriales bacterium]